jgi:opacity protein-like surface antigen
MPAATATLNHPKRAAGRGHAAGQTRRREKTNMTHGKPLILATGAALAILIGGATTPALADDRYYVEFVLGQSLNGEDSFTTTATDLPPGPAEVDWETGVVSGLALGARLGASWRLEGEFLYRTDELGFVQFPSGTRFEKGDFSSVVISANGYFDFPDLLRSSDRELRLYLGVGVGWIQEVDIDFESNGTERSYETDDLGYQYMAGVRWKFAERWNLDFEYRALSASDLELSSSTGTVVSDYAPVSLGLSLGYAF